MLDVLQEFVHSPTMSAPNHAGRADEIPHFRTFATTRWTIVLQAGGPTTDGSARALEQLCRTYWYPLYTFARRRGLTQHDAEDVTQGFFAFLLEKDTISRADRERGRFRSFLLTAFTHFQSHERARNSSLKRGGGQRLVYFDAQEAETRSQNEPSTGLTPARLFDQKWATSLLEHVLEAVRHEYISAGKGACFEELKTVLWGGRGEVSYAEIARRLGSTEGAIKVSVHRLRARFRERLQDEVANTVARAEDVEDELRHLLAALST